MATLEKVTVSASALRQVLQALNGPAHYIREIQVTRNLPGDTSNPLNVLTEEFNAAVEEFKTAPQIETPEGSCCGKCQRVEITQHEGGSASCTGKCEDHQADLHLQRMKYIYEYSMAALVKPVMTFEEWLAKLDVEIAKKQCVAC